jgi:HTH-type transcriptional regulator/antitoxin HigA
MSYCEKCGQRLAADFFPPGEYLADELRERNVHHALFASYLGLDEDQFKLLLAGEKSLFLSLAFKIATFTGTDAATWMNLEHAWRRRPNPEGKKKVKP